MKRASEGVIPEMKYGAVEGIEGKDEEGKGRELGPVRCVGSSGEKSSDFKAARVAAGWAWEGSAGPHGTTRSGM